MAERGRAKGRAETWPERRAQPWHGAPWPEALRKFAGSIPSALGNAIAVDFGPGRLMAWVPVAFGLGVALYLAAEHEPSWVAGLLLAIGLVAVTWTARRRVVAFPVVLLLAACAAGFAAATAKTTMIAHPVLERAVYGATLKGYVEVREERERSDRITIKVVSFDAARTAKMPERVRLSLKRGMAPPVGAFVSLKARLEPPQSPLRPGGYDFARDLYYQRIGAVGFVTGAIAIEPAPSAPSWRLRYDAFVDSIRDGIDRRIRQALPGDVGSIASALITGKRDAISTPVNDAMYISSLAHVLSISGYHMAVVAGVVFFVFRAGFALIPGMATRYPIKKWGAAAAFIAATLYLALSGAEVATQRSYIMTAVILFGILVDRAVLTFRTLALAAMAVLLLAPEAVAHPSFQMSFAATLALVAAYERGLPFTFGGADTSFGARIALWGVREIILLIFASLVAGLATTPFVAFHFHRTAPYGVIANLLAMPIVSAVVMPAGIVALVVMPFGFDGPLWRLMGAGIDWMIAVAAWVAKLPGAVGRIPAFGIGPLLICTAGMLLLCLLRSRLRWSGAALIVAACIIAMATRQPDVYVSPAGETVAARSHGQLVAQRFGSDPFALREWLAADGDARLPTDASLKTGFSCDDDGCVTTLDDGAVVAFARTAQALADDCARASAIVTTRDAMPDCAAIVVDRAALKARGAHALYREGEGWRMEVARPKGTDRPWARAAEPPVEASPIVSRPPARDVTPKPEDLDAGD